MVWTPQALDAAEEALRSSDTLDEALSKLSSHFGRPIGRKSLTDAMRRHRKKHVSNMWKGLPIEEPAKPKLDVRSESFSSKWPNVEAFDKCLEASIPKMTLPEPWPTVTLPLPEIPPWTAAKQEFKAVEPFWEVGIDGELPSCSRTWSPNTTYQVGDKAFGPQVKRHPDVDELETILLIPDCHHPFVDKRAWALALEVGLRIKPTHLVILGDFMDCYSISFHSKDPNRIADFNLEVEDANARLDELDQLGATDKEFLEGNHCFRLQRHLMEKSPQLVNLPGVQIPNLLKLKERGYKFTPYRKSTQIGKLHLTHEAGSAGGTAHQKARALFEGNVAIGHTHRAAIMYAGNARGESKVGAMMGWLGDIETIDYAHRVQALRDWQHGVGIAHLESATGNVHLQFHPFIDYKCEVYGKLVRG